MGEGAAEVLAEGGTDIAGEGAGLFERDSNSSCVRASRKVSSLVGLPAASSPSSTKSRVLVTSTKRYLLQ